VKKTFPLEPGKQVTDSQLPLQPSSSLTKNKLSAIHAKPEENKGENLSRNKLLTPQTPVQYYFPHLESINMEF
jgi:hypothetical protein